MPKPPAELLSVGLELLRLEEEATEAVYRRCTILLTAIVAEGAALYGLSTVAFWPATSLIAFAHYFSIVAAYGTIVVAAYYLIRASLMQANYKGVRPVNNWLARWLDSTPSSVDDTTPNPCTDGSGDLLLSDLIRSIGEATQENRRLNEQRRRLCRLAFIAIAVAAIPLLATALSRAVLLLP